MSCHINIDLAHLYVEFLTSVTYSYQISNSLYLNQRLLQICMYFSSYDPELDRWTMVKPMHYKRLAMGVAVVNRLLYAIGGYDGSERHKSAECYHPENDEWTMVAPMHTQRSGAGRCEFYM